MKLHITPSFNIDRLCKTASVLLFLVHYHLWKPSIKPMLLFPYAGYASCGLSLFSIEFSPIGKILKFGMDVSLGLYVLVSYVIWTKRSKQGWMFILLFLKSIESTVFRSKIKQQRQCVVVFSSMLCWCSVIVFYFSCICCVWASLPWSPITWTLNLVCNIVLNLLIKLY